MKVLLVIRWPVGGIRTFINYVYANFNSDEIELYFVLPNLPEVKMLQDKMTSLRCTWHITQTDRPSPLEISTLTIKAALKHNVDIIHAHGFTSAIAVGWFLPFLSQPSVFTSHDILQANQFSGFKGKCKKWLMTVLLNRFSKIHSVSHDADENLKSHLPSIDVSKCIVILNGVDSGRFYSADATDVKITIGLTSDVKLIGFFGRFMAQKGFKYLIDAMLHLEKSHGGRYHVACFGAGAFIREEREAIAAKGLSHRFYFHDFVPDTAPYMKACDLIVMPSLWEACPLQPMEVLSAGVPFVASDCLGLREVCEHTPAVMISAGNTQALIDGILAIEKKPKKVFEEYSPIAKERYDIQKTFIAIKQLYADILAK